MAQKRDILLNPFQLKHLTLKNRILSTPHEPAYSEGGMPKERYQLYHEAKAKGGLAMTMFGGSASIAPDSPSVFGQLNLATDDIIPYFRAFSKRIHKYDCGIICQVSHLGRRTVWDMADWLPVIAPSRVREPAHRAFPKEMDPFDIARVRGAYAAAALRCKEGGLDGCEVLQHGHMPEQFLSPLTNFRTDEYGGSLQNRLRFTLEILDAMRTAVGPDFIIGIRQGLNEVDPNGISLEEGTEAARIISQSGLIDYMTVNFGKIDTDHALSYHIPGMRFPLAPWVAQIAQVRAQIKVPVFHACKIADLSSARHAIESGALDMVGMVRAHIADPNIVNKLAAGQEERIRPCVGAGYCLDRIYGGGGTLCAHNAATGREATMPQIIEPTKGRRKKVVIVGGGPAGLEAARVCGERGHDVVMFEATGELGGQINLAARAVWRKDIIGIVDWLAAEVDRLGVDIRWNSMADEDMVLAENPDVVFIATGGLPDTDYVTGGGHAISTWDVLAGQDISGSVLVYDDNGQFQGVSCADFLSRKPDTAVEVITPDRAAAMEMGTVNFPIFMEHFYKNGVTVTPDHRITTVAKEGNRLRVTFSNEFQGPDIERVVDHLVVEHGTLPLNAVYEGLRGVAANKGVSDVACLVANRAQPDTGDGFELFAIGDAVSSRNIHAAIYDALRLCKDL